MQIDKNEVDKLQAMLDAYTSVNGSVAMRTNDTTNCSDCYTSGGCKGTCRGNCGSGCISSMCRSFKS